MDILIEDFWPIFKLVLTLGLYTTQIATIPASTELLAIPGSSEDGILQVGTDVVLLQGSVQNDGSYVLSRMGTTLVKDIARRLFQSGVDAVLSIDTQLALAEAGVPITILGSIYDKSNAGTLDFKGAYGVYYRELFFHIPFLIANSLNARGRYEAAQRWFRYTFDPTSTDVIDVSGLTPPEAAHRLLDRVWKYREFRGLDIVHLRDILTDPGAIALYKKDPFNPWAIARRRISALQKAVVMKYIDNLLDWGDSLFAQFTMESVSEARMLYIVAEEILGPRPVEIGDCGAGIQPMTYAEIGPLVDQSSDILVELETWMIGSRLAVAGVLKIAEQYAVEPSALHHVITSYPLTASVGTTSAPSGGSTTTEAAIKSPDAPVAVGMTLGTGVSVGAASPADGGLSEPMFRGLGWNATQTASWGPAGSSSKINTPDGLGGRTFHVAADGHRFAKWAGRFGWSFLRELTPVFCVPANTDLLHRWDRAEDRLYKIRHCEDITGQLRELALFAPPINPMQLVALTAAGLSFEDVLGATAGDLPPYRFLFLIERAKAFAATLGSFGAALQTAIEKKNAGELNHLRLTQALNLAHLMTQERQFEIDAATALADSLSRQQAAAQSRSDYYSGLVGQDRTPWEITQSISLHTASEVKGGQATAYLLAAVLHLVPEVGSPFAMKYGGVELGASAKDFGQVVAAIGILADAVASSSGLEGNFGRRSDGWTYQKKLADQDIAILDKQITAASIRIEIANQALVLHQKTIDQMQEFLDLNDSRFTNMGFFTWLSAQLQTTYRSAYQSALALAKLAERAYRFERGDDTLPGLSMAYWDPTYAGLLAGEQLLVELTGLERRFLETNYRTLEVDQAFALSQIDALALLNLRETGECTFTVAEPYFDLTYPGHFKRRIKAVRLTIPCTTGPYVNVSATLTLEDSWIRSTPTFGAALVEVPPSRSVSVATSTAQNDAGVFELSFRDERYMPFEGLGAISQWRLRLPKSFRQFDYQTMNDVIVSISYTADEDGALRDQVEQLNAALQGTLINYFTTNPSARLLSLRQDFSSAFTRLLRSAPGTVVNFTIADNNLPLFARGRNINVTKGVIIFRTATAAIPNGFQMAVDGSALPPLAIDPTTGNLPDAPLPAAFVGKLLGAHAVSITAAGDLAPTAPPPGDTSAIDPAKLLDILLYVEYQLA